MSGEGRDWQSRWQTRRSETAILYNDRAVLENLHVSSAFKTMLSDDANILANLSKEEYR